MGILDSLFGSKATPAPENGPKKEKVSEGSGDSGSNIDLYHRDGVHKAHIPEFLYKPPFGYPRKTDLPLVRMLAKSPYVFSVKKTIIDAVSTADWKITYKESWLEDNDPTPELDAIKADITKWFLNPNGNKESWSHLRRVLVSDILDVDAGVLVKVFNRKGEFQQAFARDGGSFLKNPDPYGYMGDRDEYIPPEIVPYAYVMTPDERSRDTAYQRYAGYVKQRAAYFQYATNTTALPIPFGRRELIYMMQNPQSQSVYGLSPIEVLGDVIVGLVYGSLYNLDFYLNNNMPEGVLQVLGADQKQIQAFGQQLRSTIKEPNKITGFLRRIGFRIPITNHEVKFTPFQLDPRTMQIIEQQEWFIKLVWACFGATADGMGYTEDSNRSTGQVQRQEQKAKAIVPIMELIKYHVDTEIITEWGIEAFEALEFRFEDYDVEQALKEATLNETYIRMGVKSSEMVAEELGIDVDRLREDKEVDRQRKQEDALSMNPMGFSRDQDPSDEKIKRDEDRAVPKPEQKSESRLEEELVSAIEKRGKQLVEALKREGPLDDIE
jgi:hypothetical protein